MSFLQLWLALSAFAAAPWTVGIRSFGPVPYGASIYAVGKRLSEKPVFSEVTPTEGCDYVDFKAAPAGTSFMVLDSLIVRVDVIEPGVLTGAGIQVGSPERAVLAAYLGQIRIEPHAYDGLDAHYLVYTPASAADTAFGMVFETDGLVVTRYRAGLREPVSWIEGCS